MLWHAVVALNSPDQRSRSLTHSLSMSDLAPRPRSATEIVDAAFQLYRRSPGQLMLATAMIYAPWLVIQLVLMNITGYSIATPAITPRALEMLAVLSGCGIVIYAVVDSVLTRIASELYLGRQLSAVDALRSVAGRLGVVLALGVLRLILLAVGFVLFFFPAIYVWARTFALIPSAIIEGTGVGGSFGRSSTLSVGLKWHILLTLLLVWIILLIISVATTLLAKTTGSQVVQLVAATVITVVIYPVVGLSQTVLYYDTRIRREGYDIELMAAMAAPTDVVMGHTLA